MPHTNLCVGIYVHRYICIGIYVYMDRYICYTQIFFETLLTDTDQLSLITLASNGWQRQKRNGFSHARYERYESSTH